MPTERKELGRITQFDIGHGSYNDAMFGVTRVIGSFEAESREDAISLATSVLKT